MKTKLILCLVLCIVSFSDSLRASSDSAQRLQSSVHRMAFWLGTGEKANFWRQYLTLNQLDTQAALGDRADIARLQQIHDRFSLDVKGLEHPAFVEVKLGIERHITFLASRNVQDLEAAIDSAAFQPITRQTVEQYRDLVKYEYEVLRNYYRSKLPSRKRALLFYDLELPQAIELFENMEIGKLMPEVNQGVQLIEPVIEAPQPDERTEQEVDDEQERTELRNQWLGEIRSLNDALTEKNFELNDPYFASTQLALDRFARIFFYATDKNTSKSFDRELKKLKDNFDSLGDPTKRTQHAIVGNALGWMQSANQLPQLVSAIRAKHSLPNMLVSVSSGFINQLGGRPIAQAQAVNELLLGRLIRGYAVSTGRVSIDLIDDPSQAHLSIHLMGNINSNSYSSQGPVTAYTSSSGHIEARRSIYANIAGFFADEPYAAANLSSQFLGINLPIRLIEKIAVKTYQRDKARAEGIASARAEKQILNQFTEETQTILSNGENRFAELVEKAEPVAKLVPEVYLHTTASSLNVTAHKVNQFDLAADDHPMQSPVYSDIAIKLHETFLTNYITPYVGGKTISNQEMADILMEQTGSIPDGFGPENEEDEFSITFSQIQPVRAIFEDDRLSVAITGRQFSQGGRRIRAGLVIKVKFKLVRKGHKMFLVRDGEATIDFLDRRQVNARTSGFKNFLQGKLNEQARNQEMEIELPPNLIPIDLMEIDDHDDVLKNMFLVQFSIRNGWLQVGWVHAPGGFYGMTDLHSLQNEIIVDGLIDEYTPDLDEATDELAPKIEITPVEQN